MLNRIPMLPNLKKRNVIYSEESTACRQCEANVEVSIDHLFLGCEFAVAVWEKVYSWVDCGFVRSTSVIDDLKEFSKLVSSSSKDLWLIFWHNTV